MKVLLTVTFLILFCSLSYGQGTYNSFLKDPPKPSHRERNLAIATSAFYWTAVMADVYSSRGMNEGNRLLRNSHGQLDWKKATVVAEVPFVVSLILRYKHHSKAANWIMAVFGGAHTAAAVHNWRIK